MKLNNDLSSSIQEYDPNNTHPYNELDIDEDATGKVTGAQIKVDGQNTTADFSSVGQVLGSALGRALAPNNQFVQLAASTVVGAIGQRLAQAFVASLATDASKFDPASVFKDFNVTFAGAGASSIASFLVAELGTALHLNGFSGQLFNAAGGGFAGSVASQIATKMAATPGLTFEAAIAQLDFASAAVNAAYGVSALFGSFLGHELAPAQTHEGAVGGQLLGAVGSVIGISAALTGALGTVLGFIAPGIGSLFGTIIGTLIGDAFSSVPHPAATDLLDQTGYLYGYTHYQTSASDGGSYSTPDQMVVPALAIINAYLNAVKGAALDHSKQVTLGYQTDPASYINGVPGHPTLGVAFNANAAVQAAALDVLQNTEVIGGDLLMKRAHQNSSSSHSPAPLPVDPNSNGDPGATGSAVQVSAAEQLAVMSGDLGVAQDYENYLNNREAINALMAANPDSAFTAGWIATFARVNELGLNHVNASDFTGGLVGYLDSVNKAGLGSWASSASVSYGGAGNSVITISIKTPNGVEVPGSLAAFADATTVSSDASGQTVQLIIGANLAAVGYHRLDAGTIRGDGANDLWFGDGSGQTFYGSGGHDILTGGSGNDTIYGGPGWDFVQGGAGNDTLFGDDGNDILSGGAGNDVLNGGAGLDTAVFSGPVGSYTLVSYNGIIGVLSHGAEGSDRLEGIEYLQFTNTGIAPGAVAAFDALAYLASWPDLIVTYGLNPLAGFDHYVGGGFAEGRTITFDPFQYIASNPDLIVTFGLNAQSAEQHYIVSGYYEHRPTHSFDAFEYIASNPDLIVTFGLNPLAGEQHYITNGYYEGRPTHSFDAVEYLASNPDLIAAFGLNPLAGEQHYITNGYHEGRPTHSFDAVEYLASNPDLIAAFGLNPLAAEQHYIASGFNEHRSTTSFDAAQYLANNPDLAAAFGNDLAMARQHYIVSGYYEGRTDNHAPVLTVPAGVITATPGEVLHVASWFSATDADNDALTYSFGDSSPAADSGQFVLNGTPLGQGAVFNVSAAQLAGLTFVAGAAGVTDSLSMQLSDGHAVSANLAIQINDVRTHAVVTDFNGDGKSDILWYRDDGTVSIWDDGQIASAHWISGPGVVAGSWHIKGDGDFDFNGHDDILWQNDNAAVSVWDNGTLAGAHITADPGVVAASWHIAGVGDFDGNHHDDVLWRNDDGSVSIWDNGQLANAHVAAGAGVVPAGWHIDGIGDFDGNGRDDILWHRDDGTIAIWDNGQVAGAHFIVNPGTVSGNWHIAGTGDFDGNGRLDILWRNDNGAVSIWDNGQIGGAHIVADAGVVPAGWNIEGVGDFDGNGKDDVLWRNDNATVAVWDNGQISAAHWIADPGQVANSWHIA